MIDVETHGSPGWWLLRAQRQLSNDVRGKRLPNGERIVGFQELFDRIEGRGPLPQGAEGLEEAYCAFQRKSRTNWTLKSVASKQERVSLTGFRTAVDNDGDGDGEAADMAKRARLFAEFPDAAKNALLVGRGYLHVGSVGGRTVVTSEDPRQTITFHDPATAATRAGVKLYRDPDDEADFGFVMLPQLKGRCRLWKAKRRIAGATIVPRVDSAWEWEIQGEELPVDEVPIYRLLNRRSGLSEITPHVDLLDRVSHGVLQRLVINAMQAYKQRATIGAVWEDAEGNPVDPDGLLSAGPGAVWDLPDGTTLWEGSQADVQGVLMAAKDDLRELSEVMSMPLPVMVPDAANQSAEGAAFNRESLVFACSEIINSFADTPSNVLAAIAAYEGDESRSDADKVVAMWADPARRSLSEMADASSKAKNDLSRQERLVKIWGYTPAEAKRIADAKRAEEMEAQAMGLFAPSRQVVASGADDAS